MNEKTYFISHSICEPYFNLASEEYLLTNKTDYFVYIWRNSPSVIIGVNQNAAAEVNLNYAENHNIKVVRRQTGGGAVYHDENNVCYTIIAPYDSAVNSFRFFSEKILLFLGEYGIKAEFSGRNDLLVDGKKFSGAAERVYKNRIIHHGTLLFNSDFSALDKVLLVDKTKLESKSIKSVKSRVTNLKPYFSKDFSVEDFFLALENYLKKDLPRYEFDKTDLDLIDNLVKEKYSTFKWNIGAPLKAEFNCGKRFSCGYIGISFDLIEGKLKNVNINGDFFCKKPLDALLQSLENTKLTTDDLNFKLKNIGEYVLGANGIEIAALILGNSD